MYRICALSVVLFLFFSSCGVTSVYFLVKRPAPVNLNGHKNIAVGSFTGKNRRHSNSAATSLEKELIDTGYFTKVVDRKKLENLLGEQKIQLNGPISQKDYARIGKISGASVLIYGTLDNDNYMEQVTSRTIVKTNSTEEIRTHKHRTETNTIYTYQTNVEYARTGEYSLSVSYQIMDVETSELIAVKQFSAERQEKKKNMDEEPGMIDANDLFLDCSADVSSRFVRELIPYEEYVRADFQIDNELPEIKSAVDMIKSGNSEQGLKILISLTNRTGLKPEVRAKTYYDLALMLSHYKNYDEARNNIRKAIELNSKEKMYPDALYLNAKEKENSEKLKEQGLE